MNAFFTVMKGEIEYINPKQLIEKGFKERKNRLYRQA